MAANEKLREYRAKRDFRRTPEPAESGPPVGNRFVIQRHSARRLHFDFRLEMGGVLKSWAVPKGLPAQPKEKRLAIMTEDHPLGYIDFEGTIPEGQYGAGTVEIWDRGTYRVLDAGDPEAQLGAGKLNFVLQGQRLSGEFTLIRTRFRGEESWLLIRHQAHGAGVAVIQRETEKLVRADGRELKLTNLTKVFWPDEGYVKADLIHYYNEMADVLLPHLQGRPMVMKRYPGGIDGPYFFQKDTAPETPAWIRTAQIKEAPKTNRYIICDDRPTLIYLANLACIDLNPWSSRVESLDNPDWLILDLDPFDAPYTAVIEVAQTCKGVLDMLGLSGYAKTSGATGMHIFVPVAPVYTYDQVRRLGEIIATLVLDRAPELATLEHEVSQRTGKVYVDYLQNVRGKTVASVYSARPERGATVSTPLEWHEVAPDLDPRSFTIRTVPARVKEKADLFRPVLTNKQRIETAVEKLEKVTRTKG